jgi:hypothetical protein
MQADTLYIRRGTSIDNPMDRSYIVHEATHATQDASQMTGTHLDAEVDAYRVQARYMFAQLNAATGARRAETARSLAGDLSSSLQAALLETAIASPEFGQAFAELMVARPNPAGPDPQTLLATPQAAALRNLRRVITSEYGEGPSGTAAAFQGVGHGR